MPTMTEVSGLSRARFEQDVVPAYQPVVIRGLVSHWPLVEHANAGLEAVLRYLDAFANPGQTVDALLARPSPERSFSYRASQDGFNFAHEKRDLAAIFEQLWRYSHFEDPPCLAVQSALVAEALPGLERAHVCPLLDAEVSARIWIGNRATVPAHFDDSHNLACVAAGSRRFTLLPPQCAPLLYLAAPDYAPTGAPMSVVPELHSANLDQFPLLREALDQALVAELAPGDAVYIPPLWFHQVQALAPQLNILMNYWWRPAAPQGRKDDLHMAAMRLAMLAYRHLPASEREGWRALLGHYVFGAQDQNLAHIPETERRLLGTVDAPTERAHREDIIRRLRD